MRRLVVAACGGALPPTAMKSRLAASTYLFSGRFRGIARSTVTSIYRRHCKINRSFQVQGSESSNRYAHSSAIEDDVFSELGPEASEVCTERIKLFTEKPDCVTKTSLSRGESDGRPISSCAKPRPSTKAIIATMSGVAPTSKPKLDDSKKLSDIEYPNSILVKNIISEISLSELVAAISIHGKVSGASFVVAPSGLRHCNIEFEDVGSRRRAILAGKIAIGGQEFIVDHLGAVDKVAFRIENIHEETTEYAIHSICKTIGEVVGLSRTKKDGVEVFFNVRNDSNHLNILENLNSTVKDGNKWSAHFLTSKPADSSKVSSNNETRLKYGMQILDHIPELKRQMTMNRMAVTDLNDLIHSIMHIEEDLPSAVGFSSGSK